MICKKCQEKFKSWVMIDGVLKRLGSRKYCLKCSPYKSHNTKKIHIISELDKNLIKCPKCKKVKDKNDFYLKKGKVSHSYCKQCNKESAVKRAKENKRRAVEYKGGKCIICGYKKCIGALDFHHTGDDKLFGIRNTSLRSFEKIKDELDKCVLVCKNCHAEIEAGIINLAGVV